MTAWKFNKPKIIGYLFLLHIFTFSLTLPFPLRASEDVAIFHGARDLLPYEVFRLGYQYFAKFEHDNKSDKCVPSRDNVRTEIEFVFEQYGFEIIDRFNEPIKQYELHSKFSGLATIINDRYGPFTWDREFDFFRMKYDELEKYLKNTKSKFAHESSNKILSLKSAMDALRDFRNIPRIDFNANMFWFGFCVVTFSIEIVENIVGKSLMNDKSGSYFSNTLISSGTRHSGYSPEESRKNVLYFVSSFAKKLMVRMSKEKKLIIEFNKKMNKIPLNNFKYIPYNKNYYLDRINRSPNSFD